MTDSEAKIPNQKNQKTKFQSPLPFIVQLRNLIFGKDRPGIYTQITFYINLIGTIIFGLWSTVSYFAISYRAIFHTQKGVDVAAIINERGIELGFTEGNFIERLSTFHGVSMVCWTIILFSLVLLWRRKRVFAYFFFVPFLFYFGMMVFYISFTYFLEDTTGFDKVVLLILLLNTVSYQLFAQTDEEEEELTFFDA